MTRNAVSNWKVLALALLLWISAPQVRAEEPTVETGETPAVDPAPTRTVESETTGTTTKTEDGREWQRSTTGTVTGSQGGERDYTVERSGSVTHGAEGVTTRESSQTYTNEQGKRVTVDKSGTATKNADGSVSYQGTKTVTHPSGESRSYETTGSSKVETEEDGSKTREGSHTTTNTETGRSRTVENSSQVTPTENGKTFTNDRKVENSAGGSHSSHTEGQVTRNGDGTGSATSHTDRQGTTARGKTWSGSTDRQGSYERSNGSVKTQRSATHSGSGKRGARRH